MSKALYRKALRRVADLTKQVHPVRGIRRLEPTGVLSSLLALGAIWYVITRLTGLWYSMCAWSDLVADKGVRYSTLDDHPVFLADGELVPEVMLMGTLWTFVAFIVFGVAFRILSTLLKPRPVPITEVAEEPNPPTEMPSQNGIMAYGALGGDPYWSPCNEKDGVCYNHPSHGLNGATTY